MIETMKKLAACAFAACALCLAAAGVAWGGAAPGIELEDAGDGAVAVSLKLPESPDHVRALKLTLAVEAADADALGADFAFDGTLEGVEVRQARTSVVEGVRHVSVYVAAQDRELFEGGELSLGTLALSSDDGVAAKVSAVGFEAVNAAHDAMGPEEAGLGALESSSPLDVQVPAAGGTTPNPPQQPEGEGDGSKDDGTGGTGSNGANVSPGAPSGTDASLVATGDGLLPVVAVCAGVVLVAGIVALVVARRSRR